MLILLILMLTSPKEVTQMVNGKTGIYTFAFFTLSYFLCLIDNFVSQSAFHSDLHTLNFIKKMCELYIKHLPSAIIGKVKIRASNTFLMIVMHF